MGCRYCLGAVVPSAILTYPGELSLWYMKWTESRPLFPRPGSLKTQRLFKCKRRVNFKGIDDLMCASLICTNSKIPWLCEWKCKWLPRPIHDDLNLEPATSCGVIWRWMGFYQSNSPNAVARFTVPDALNKRLFFECLRNPERALLTWKWLDFLPFSVMPT